LGAERSRGWAGYRILGRLQPPCVGSNVARIVFEFPPRWGSHTSHRGDLRYGTVNCGMWIAVTLLATLLMGCASQSSPCRSIDPQDLESEGAREYCRDLEPLRALEVAVADEAYELLKGMGLAPGATPGVAQALNAPAMPAP